MHVVSMDGAVHGVQCAVCSVLGTHLPYSNQACRRDLPESASLSGHHADRPLHELSIGHTLPRAPACNVERRICRADWYVAQMRTRQ